MKKSYISLKKHLKYHIYGYFSEELRKVLINFKIKEFVNFLRDFSDFMLKDEPNKIDLSKNTIRENVFPLLKYLTKIPYVKCINLNFYNGLIGIGIAKALSMMIPNLRHLVTLSLDLGKNYIEDEGAKLITNSISKLIYLNHLSLELSNNHIGNKGLSYLSNALSKFTHLTIFELNLCNIKLFVEDEMNVLIKNTNDITITDQGFSALSDSIKSLQSLKVLKLYFTGNSLQYKSMKYLSRTLRELKKLFSLDLYLGNNIIMNVGVKHLVDGIKNLMMLNKLHLYLGNTGINDNCVNDLINNIPNNYESLKLFLNENKIISNKKILIDHYGNNVIF